MPAPLNTFKQALVTYQPLMGLWVALASSNVAELCAGAGYDWMLIDGEHGPNDLLSIQAQLQAVAPFPTHPVVRLPVGEAHRIKQMLDIGAQSLLVPMIETGEQALAMVRACRYPPEGIRGVGASLGRATHYGRIPAYATTANDQICLIVQVESRKALDNLDEIAATPGVDAIFIGPADLAADMGYPDNAGAPEVMAAVEGAVVRIRALGKAAGIMTYDLALAHRCMDLGATMVATASDAGLLVTAAERHLADFKARLPQCSGGKSY